MARKIDALIFYEHADRELDVVCAVKCLAEEKYGLKVEIIQHPLGQLSADLPIRSLEPRLVFVPHAYHSGTYAPYALDWPQATFINLMWEQLLYPGNSEGKKPLGKLCLEHMIHLVWGDFTIPYLREAGVLAQNIRVNGNLVYKLYEAPYHNFYLTREQLAQTHNLAIQKKWLFFPENYNWAFYSDQVLKEMQELNRDVDVYALRQFCLDSLNETFRWCKALAHDAQFEVIIRPRPYTPLEKFTDAVKQVIDDKLPANLHIIKDQTVREWILASEVIVSSYSTSLLEAAVANKPAYLLAPLPIPAPLHMEWHGYISHLKTQAEFLEACHQSPTTGSNNLADWTRRTMLAHGDPIENLAKLIKQIVTAEVVAPPPIPPLEILTPQGKPIRNQLEFQYQRWQRKYQHLSVQFKRKQVQSNPIFEKDLVSQKEINRRTRQWRTVLNQKLNT